MASGEQLVIAITAVAGALAFVFRMLASSWNHQVRFLESELIRCQKLTEASTANVERSTDLAARAQAVREQLP